MKKEKKQEAKNNIKYKPMDSVFTYPDLETLIYWHGPVPYAVVTDEQLEDIALKEMRLSVKKHDLLQATKGLKQRVRRHKVDKIVKVRKRYYETLVDSNALTENDAAILSESDTVILSESDADTLSENAVPILTESDIATLSESDAALFTEYKQFEESIEQLEIELMQAKSLVCDCEKCSQRYIEQKEIAEQLHICCNKENAEL